VKELANQYFSMWIIVAFLFGIIVSVIGFAFASPIAAFQSFFVAAEKTSLSLKINILAGIANIFFITKWKRYKYV